MRTIIQLVYLSIPLLIITGPSMATNSSPVPANPYFHAVQLEGRWWLLDPHGHRFLSKGITTVQFSGDTIKGTSTSPYLETVKTKYGSPDAWRKAAAQRLVSWGFNSLGAWSDDSISACTASNQHLAYAPIVDLGATFVGEKQRGMAWLHGIFPDVFDPDFETIARQRAREVCTPRSTDPWLLGWFTDNELRWGPDWRGPDELLTLFLDLPATVPGKKAAVDLMRERYGDVSKFNAVWNAKFASWDDLSNATSVPPPVVRKAVYQQNEETERQANEADPKRAAFVTDCDAFLARLADRYFRVTSEAIKAADPNHMNFGCRFAYFPPRPVVAAAAKYVDVVSFNCYRTDPRETVSRYAAFGKPLIIGEFAFRAEDSGLPNTRGAGPKVKTQAERASAFRSYVTQALQNPYLVGYHWFEHCDEPKEGRFDGENSNYGVVNIHDEVYTDLTQAMTQINAQAESIHDGTAVPK
ncbi:MAG TPA: agarase [Verrucomicrobiae bacterium]|nr:agarase [Verrucomicrobiae bacterium]